MVLRRVEHLEERRRRVAAPVGADLVDLVQQDDRVHRPRVAEGADEPSRERADVGAAVAADLGLVPDAAERHPHELAVERAGDRLADRGLAGPGRADQGEDRAGALVGLDAALLAQLAHGEVLDDAVLHVGQPGVIGVEHLTRVRRVEPLFGRLPPRDVEQPVEVRPDHLRLGGLVAHPLETRQLALGLLAHGVGHLRFGDARAVVLGGGRVVFAELLADRVHLAAQDVLALLTLCAGLDVLADAPPNLQLGEPLALEPDCELQPLDDVDRLEQLDLLGEAHVRRVARRVGQRAGVADRANEVADARVGVAQLEDLLDRGAVLALELGRADARRVLVGLLVDLDAQASVGPRRRGARDAAVQPLQGHRVPAAGQPQATRHLGDGADAGVLALVHRHEEHTLLVARLDRERHRHVREDDAVLERDQQQIRHVLSS